MALRVPFSHPRIVPNPQNRAACSTTLLSNRERVKVFCANDRNDAELAADLASEVVRINTHMVQRKDAMEKSRRVLFGEFCLYLRMGAEEVRDRWRKMDEAEKMSWSKSFVSEWGEGFHPLSSNSVKEMVEEHLAEETPTSIAASFMLPGLKRILGFLENKPK